MDKRNYAAVLLLLAVLMLVGASFAMVFVYLKTFFVNALIGMLGFSVGFGLGYLFKREMCHE